MNNQIVRVVHDLAVAERVRDELLAAGFARESVELSTTGDEAGPGQANFTVGDSPEVKGGTDYKDVYNPREQERRPCVVMVAAADAMQAEQASAILERHGAADMDNLRRHGRH